MSLETFGDPSELYLARGREVSEYRPLFTGDVVSDVTIPGIQEGGLAIVISHPCSMRGKSGVLNNTTLLAAVRPHESLDAKLWTRG